MPSTALCKALIVKGSRRVVPGEGPFLFHVEQGLTRLAALVLP